MASDYMTGVHPAAFIHPKAHVENASIGAMSKVWQFASVIRGARLGEDCSVGSGAQIDGAVLGDRCLVGQCASLVPGLACGNDVFIAPGTLFCNDAWPSTDKGGFTPHSFAAGFVTIEVRDGASIGAGAIVMPGVRIGRRAMVAAGAVVTANVPPGWLWKRDGRMDEIDPERMIPRMRAIRVG